MKLLKFSPIGLKNLIKGPATRLYPQVPYEAKKGARGKLGIEIEQCIFCGICGKRCPTDAIRVNRLEKTWEIERFGCLACGLCVDVCPKKCIHMEEDYTAPNQSKLTEQFKQKTKEEKE